jgi:hypothetical protein
MRRCVLPFSAHQECHDMTAESQQRRATGRVVTDLSTAADEAIRQGHEWAARTGADLFVCHVVPTYHRVNALFPQRNEVDTLSAIELERRVADLVTTRVSEITAGLRTTPLASSALPASSVS